MDNVQLNLAQKAIASSTFHDEDFKKFRKEFQHSAYTQNPRMTANGSMRSKSNRMKTGKPANRRLKSGHSNNRTNLSVYTSNQNFVDPMSNNQRKKKQQVGKSESFKNKTRDPYEAKPVTAQYGKRI